MQVNREILLVGILRFTIEAKILLQDALSLYKQGRLAGSVILATLSLEHLGQAFWLISIAGDEERGQALTAKQLADALRKTDHETKLKRGLIAFMSNAPSSGVNPSTLQRGTVEFNQALEHGFLQMRKMHKREPTKLHSSRVTAQYPELNKAGNSWRSSSELTKSLAANTLLQAGTNLRWAQIFGLKPVDGLLALSRTLRLEDAVFETVEHEEIIQSDLP